MSTGLVAKAKAESVRTSTQGYGSAERYSFVFACLVVLAITIAAVRWILDHSYGIHLDEALYFDNVLRDIHKPYSGSLPQERLPLLCSACHLKSSQPAFSSAPRVLSSWLHLSCCILFRPIGPTVVNRRTATGLGWDLRSALDFCRRVRSH